MNVRRLPLRLLSVALIMVLTGVACGSTSPEVSVSTDASADLAAEAATAVPVEDVAEAATAVPVEEVAEAATAVPVEEVAEAATAVPTPAPVAVDVSPEEAAAAAEQNIPLVVGSGEWAESQVLSVSTGQITSLSEAVDGDRPVLVWFYAPH